MYMYVHWYRWCLKKQTNSGTIGFALEKCNNHHCFVNLEDSYMPILSLLLFIQYIYSLSKLLVSCPFFVIYCCRRNLNTLIATIIMHYCSMVTSTWCIMTCLVIPILSLVRFIQSLHSLSKLHFFTFTGTYII